MNCPSCGNPMIEGALVDGRDARACLCGNFVFTTPAMPPHRHTDAPEKPKGTSRRSHPEYDLLLEIKRTLNVMGYIVCRTGQRNARLGGQDAGTPDAFVTRPEWGSRWIAFEVKTEKGTLSPAQKALHEAGCTIVVRSVEDAIDAVESRR